jgi:hypothetical protein
MPTAVTFCTLPIFPALILSQKAMKLFAAVIWKPTATRIPLSFAVFIISSISCMVTAGGFSSMTLCPAFTAVMSISLWSISGVHSTMKSSPRSCLRKLSKSL